MGSRSSPAGPVPPPQAAPHVRTTAARRTHAFSTPEERWGGRNGWRHARVLDVRGRRGGVAGAGRRSGLYTREEGRGYSRAPRLRSTAGRLVEEVAEP